MKCKKGKLFAMLEHFADGRRIHRFDAERLGDHCLPTTISDLQKKHGIYFDRQTVTVPNRFGSETAVSQYWLAGVNMDKAQEIVRPL